MPLTILELILALLAIFNCSVSLRNIQKSYKRSEWAEYSRRLKTAYIASAFTPFGWLLIVIALQRSSQLLSLLLIAILYYFLVSAPVSRLLSQHKIQEAVDLVGFQNLKTISRLVENAWELSGYRCRHNLEWTKQDDYSILASWSRKPGQTVVYCTFFQDNTYSEPSKESVQTAVAGSLNNPDDYLQATMKIVMAMSYVHERPCLRKLDLLEMVRGYFLENDGVQRESH